MLLTFYNRYSLHLICFAVLSFPYLYYKAETLPANNDIETWLPKESQVRSTYEEFKSQFGAEELILIGLVDASEDERLVEAICRRVENLPGIRSCWSPSRLRGTMRELGVDEHDINERLQGLAVSADGQLIGLVALLSKAGLKDRATTVKHVREELAYCQVYGEEAEGESAKLAGAPIVIAELDRLGNRDNNKQFFLITLLICLGLLYHSLREWKLTLSILGLTIWAINVTLAGIHLVGGEMNFILDALPVMVMIFTLAIAVHFLHYYSAAAEDVDPLEAALRQAWKPCCLATLTTTIGLISLTISNIAPVSQFGYAAAAGSVIALFTGLGLTPAVLTMCPPQHLRRLRQNHSEGKLMHAGNWLLRHCWGVSGCTLLLVSVSCVGLFSLNTKIDPLDFLPKDGVVRTDISRIQRDLVNTESVEAVVDFGERDLSFVEKLTEVRTLATTIQSHPAVEHTMSLATFFPETFPEDPFETIALLKRARSLDGNSDYMSDGERLWRISVRLNPKAAPSQQQVFDELATLTADSPVTYTGIAPLLERAQQEIFFGFWESFITAFGIITLVMIASLRSFKAGLVAMIPNLTPICLVFGVLGWLDWPIDIGMMMTGSIALGIAVDGTFHFLVRYQEQYNSNRDSPAAAAVALAQTGPPILQATVIAGAGMLALTLSSFGPTARFGFLMATMLAAALIGDLVLLPCLLSLRPRSKKKSPPLPHFVASPGRRSLKNHLSTNS